MNRFTKKLKNIYVQSLFGTGGVSILSFILSLILFRILPAKDIGVWFFFQASLAFVDTFRQGFLTTTFVKFYSGSSSDRRKEILGSTWYIATVITATFLIISLPFIINTHYIKDHTLNYFLRNFGIYMTVSLPMVIAMCVCQGELQFDKLLYIRLCQVSLLIVLVLLLYATENVTLNNLMYVNLISVFLTSCLVLLKGLSGVKYFFRRTKSCMKELITFGKYTVGSSISTTLFNLTNTYLINFFLGSASVGVYNLGCRLMEIVEIPLRSFVATALPSLSKLYNEKNKGKFIEVMKQYIGSITIVLLPFLLIAFIFADVAMKIIGGNQYDIGTKNGITAANIFRILALYSLFYPLDRFMAIAIDVIHKPEINFIKVLIMLIVNFIACLIAVHVLGNLYGIVIGSIFPTLVAVFISYTSLQKYYTKFNLYDTLLTGYHLLRHVAIRNYKQLIVK